VTTNFASLVMAIISASLVTTVLIMVKSPLPIVSPTAAVTVVKSVSPMMPTSAMLMETSPMMIAPPLGEISLEEEFILELIDNFQWPKVVSRDGVEMLQDSI